MTIREVDLGSTDELPISDDQRRTGVRGLRRIGSSHLLAVRAASFALCFSDKEAMIWQVFEWLPSNEDEPSAVASLIFLSDEKFRRVREYPANWRTFDAAALESLSWHK